MIKLTLKCTQDHTFDRWFQSSGAFDVLAKAGHLSCAICGSSDVEKSIMAPRVSTSRKALDKSLAAPASDTEAAMSKLKKHVEETSEYVGADFATEARAIHDGTSEKTAIYGEAKLEDAKKLIKDGVPVAPLPFAPTRKVN
jgi:hypothetical protein